MSTPTPIPVIGIPVVNSTFWVSRLLMSIDYPVDEVFIINNNGRGELDEDLDKLASLKHKFVKKVRVAHLPGNLGVAGSWKLLVVGGVLSVVFVLLQFIIFIALIDNSGKNCIHFVRLHIKYIMSIVVISSVC